MLDDSSVRRQHLKTARTGLLTAIGCAAAGAVYEHFSFGVWSNFMGFAFLIPLLGGTLPGLLLERLPVRRRPGGPSRWLWGAGLTVLTAGSLFRGVLEIYGTTSHLCAVYWLSGGALCLAGGLWYALRLLRKKKACQE
jgi:drug/metabolite transporter (DMT)-like permease